MVKRQLFILTLLLLSFSAFAQSSDAKKYSRSSYDGYVTDLDSDEPIRNTHVISKIAHCGTVTNEKGRFHIQAGALDTLWVSCIGYSRRLIPIDSTMADTLRLTLTRDTITLREVTVFPFYDYNTFKQLIINMPSKPMPREIQRLNEELASTRTGKKRDPYFNLENGGFTASPIQYLYDHFNASARRQNQLMRNRRMFNEILREQGLTDELLPDSLDYMIEYHYDLDSIK
jgi:hypothetical protein